MPRAPAIREADIKRAIAALKASGVDVMHIEVRPGGVIRVVPGAALTHGENTPHPADLDSWRAAKNAARANQGT